MVSVMESPVKMDVALSGFWVLTSGLRRIGRKLSGALRVPRAFDNARPRSINISIYLFQFLQEFLFVEFEEEFCVNILPEFFQVSLGSSL